MAYYERDYYADEQRGGFSPPRLGRVGKVLIFLVPVCYFGLVAVTDSLVNVGKEAIATDSWVRHLMLTPGAVLPLDDGFPAPWQLLTASLVIDSLLEALLVCIVTVWLIGGLLEAAIGSWRYLFLILTSALAGNLCAALIDPFVAPGASSCGMTPVSAGMFVAIAVLFRDARTFGNLRYSTLLFILLGINALFALMSYTDDNKDMVSPLPALAGGAAWGWLFFKLPFVQGMRAVRLPQRKEKQEDYSAFAERFSDRPRGSETKIREQKMLERAKERDSKEQQELDTLLDRISREGVSSLSRKEKAFLERMSKERREKTGS